MDEPEKIMFALGKDVAAMAATQREFQLAQAKTSSNIDKLTDTVQVLLRETTKLETCFTSISYMDKKIEKVEGGILKRLSKIESAYTLWSRVVIGAIFVAFVGVIFKYVGA